MSEQRDVTDAVSDIQIGAGRPRSAVTAQRDADVLATLANRGPMTRNALASLLDEDPGRTYMSLYRLRVCGNVKLDGRNWIALVDAPDEAIGDAVETSDVAEHDAAAA